MSGVVAYLNDYIALGVAAGVEDQEAYDAWRDVALDPDVGVALAHIALALHNYDNLAHSWRCEYRTAEKGWKEGDPPVIDCECGLDELEAAEAELAGVVDQQSRT